MLQSLQELMNRQQQLTDRSFRRSQQNRPGQSRPGQSGRPGQQPGQQMQQGQSGEDDGGDDAADQEAVRRQLGDMMRQLGEMMGDVPGGFGRAERAMRDAGDALSRGNAGRALRPQMDALDQLRAGARELVQRLQDQMAQGEGEGEQAEPNMETMNGRDPAGRPLNGLGGMDGRDVRIPEEAEVQRSREILDELMRRAGERFRPRLEREYIDRLLKRF
jgi:hypothetical protein